jgi:hypothetical protein
MACTDTKLADLLADYWSGALEDHERQLVEAHLAGCESCREKLRVVELMYGRSRPEAGSGHPPRDSLIAFYMRPGDLDDEVVAGLRAHLDDCDECRREFGFLTDMERDLRASLAAAPGVAVPRVSFADRLRSIFWRPALGYVLVLLLLYPATRWLLAPESETPSPNPPVELRELLRSPTDAPVVDRRADDPVVRLRVPFYHLADKKAYRWTVCDDTGDKEYDVQVISTFDEPGTINVLLNTAGLNDGKYQLVLREIDREDPDDISVSQFPLQITTTP